MARHPLQQFSSPSRRLSLLFHLLGTADFAYCFYCLTRWKYPRTNGFGWHFQYITNIGLGLSTVSFALGALADITSSSAIFNIKNAISVLGAPLEITVTVLYWEIVAMRRNLIVQAGFKLPLLLNLGFHLAPAIFQSLDYILFSPPWTLSTSGLAALSAAFAFGYKCWVDYCHSRNGWYPYPLLEVLNTPQQLLLHSFTGVLVFASSRILNWAYTKANGSAPIGKEQTAEFVKKQE
ncbi:FAR-17a/AIG1-like protein domain-containing protein [Trichoderma breve]|uniref:FAR-17a/AIG1-like protein domain-containing protein n=1 Tax=Trichoderma breve TaxID=2034170 RepID=A0A9W9BEC7_9HYPO|nr:FAR-17a/AIG1-like protein domain-containing protein [Trichoderma breve]KAJ4858810.1 FAR-17a/AIG1-like protein domain-containing protein [Trichoderma breve]